MEDRFVLSRKIDSMTLADGAFASLFQKGELDVPAYLTLLNLGPGADVAVARIETALTHETAPADRLALFEPINWRPHLVAGVAILVDVAHGVPVREEDLRALWYAIDRGSWVSPQLLVVAFFGDPDFGSALRERGESKLPHVGAGIARDWKEGIEAIFEKRSARLVPRFTPACD